MADQNSTGAHTQEATQEQQQGEQAEDEQKQEQEQKEQQGGEDNLEVAGDTDGQRAGQQDDGEQELQEQRHAFRFHFGPNEDGGEGEGDEEELPPLAPAEEILYRPQGVQATDMEEWAVNDDIKLLKGLVGGEQAAELLNDPRVTGNDLIPNVYEGGFKLWEGAGDLCRYLAKKLSLTSEHLLRGPQDHKTPLSGKRVLELGCGHGLPGILAMLAGAEVHFQDFNREVLMSLTVPNVLANASRMPPGRAKLPVRFYAGDWLTVGDMLTAQGYGGHYDVILTAESVYSRESQERLLECIKQVLQPPHGVVYVSAKSYYHGVGGGTRSFAELVRAEHLFECKTVLRIDDKAAGNVREVLELKFPEAIMPYFL